MASDLTRSPTSWEDAASTVRALSERPLSRRSFLRGSIGSAVLLAVPGAFLANQASAAVSPAAETAPFFIYGLPSSELASAPLVEVGDGASDGNAVSLVPLVSQLASLPAPSPDGKWLALFSLEEITGGVSLTITVVDRASGVSTSSGSVNLACPADAMVLLTPVFAADSITVAVVLSVTIPSNWKTIQKFDPRTGGTVALPSATWTSHHELVYYDAGRSSFSGPFDLADAPSLARVSVAADTESLFVWTLADPRAAQGTQVSPLPMPTPQIACYSLGSGKARYSCAASQVWPTEGEQTLPLGDGSIARLVSGGQIEVYSSVTGAYASVVVDALAGGDAKPAPTSWKLLSDGTVMLVNAALGCALRLDPTAGFAALQTITFPQPAFPRGAPSRKGDLSADGATLYVLGGRSDGGLAAYDMASGAPITAQANGESYVGLRALPNGNVLAISPDNPRISLFSSTLDPLGAMETDLHVVEVY